MLIGLCGSGAVSNIAESGANAMAARRPEHEHAAILARLDHLVERMQKIQREIRATGEPASRFEIATLEKLGHAYAVLIARLRNL